MNETILKFVTRRMLKGSKFSPMREPILPIHNEIGLYVHIPFCRLLCRYCPYNRYPFKKEQKDPYVAAIKQEIDIYKRILSDTRINTLYFGGGTPTIMVKELIEIIEYLKKFFDIGEICVEANPDDLSDESLKMLLEGGIKKLSIGVQSFDDALLKNIGRYSHDGKTALDAIRRALTRGFSTVNVDIMFALPNQTLMHLKNTLEILVNLNVPQITFYPLLLFPYTKMTKDVKMGKISLPNSREEKNMYNAIVAFLKSHDYEPATVWSFVKKGVEKYGSVEREEYIGVGAGAMTVTDIGTYANTFPVDEYINTVNKGNLPIAFGHKSTRKEAMTKWFNMRLYELGFRKEDFYSHFDSEVEDALSSIIRIFRLFKLITIDGGSIKVPESAFYSVHSITKTFLSTYIAKICEAGIKNAWPEQFEI